MTLAPRATNSPCCPVSRLTGHVDPSTHFSGKRVNQDLFAGHALFSANLRLVGTRSPHRRCPQKWGPYLSPSHQTLSNQVAGTLGAPSATVRNVRFQFRSDHSLASR